MGWILRTHHFFPPGVQRNGTNVMLFLTESQMAAGRRLKTEKSGVIYSVSLEGGGGDVSSFFLLVHQDAGVGPGDGWVSAGLSMRAWKGPQAHSGQTQEAKGQTRKLQSYCAAQSNASEMPLYG